MRESTGIRLFVGFDQREAVAFHVFVQSVIEHASVPVSITALSGGQRDGSNAFTYSRFRVPELCGFEGWAIFADGDMLLERDIVELWMLRDGRYAVQVVQHDYRTRHPRKYVGSALECSNEDYPRKNWSSLILWNCGSPANRCLTREYIAAATGARLHRFAWLDEGGIGALPKEWNHLVGEDAPSAAALRHFTLGVPGLAHYADCEGAGSWHQTLRGALECGSKTEHAL